MSCAIAAAAIAVVGVGVSMYAASEQASSQREAAKYQTEAGGRQRAQSEWEAEQIWKQAEQESSIIRSKAIQLRGTQVAQQAASGVMVGDGSAQAMLDETTKLAEQDVMATLYNGARGVLAKEEAGRLAEQDALFQSKQLYASARNTMIGATGSAITSLASIGMGAAARSGSAGMKTSPSYSPGSSSFASQASGSISPTFLSGNY